MQRSDAFDTGMMSAIPDVLRRYFINLADGKFEEATKSFSEDIFYSHEAYDPGGLPPTNARLESRGRKKLLELFHLRGVRNWKHRIVNVLADSQICFLEGTAFEPSGGALLSYVAVATFDKEGLVRRYVEYDTRPPVGEAAQV